jgi:transposase
MISAETVAEIEKREWHYILGVRMRSSTEAKAVVRRAGRYAEVHPKSNDPDDPSPLKMKGVWVEGRRRYVVCVNKQEARYDGKWVLTTNTDLRACEVALKYRQLWMVEAVFRSMKSLLDTRPIFQKCDETIRGHVFCSFLVLVLRKELEDRLARKEWKLEWADVIRDLDNLLEMEVPISGKGYVFRSQAKGTTGKVFQACGVAVPPALRPC